MSGVSREEAVALGEGVTAGPWSTGGHHFPGNVITLLFGVTEVGDIPLDQSDRIVTTLNLGAAAPRLRETVVELHDRVAELTAELASLRAQVADVGWAGDWFSLDGERVRWLRVHGGTEDQTWHLIDEGAIAPQASLYRGTPGRWLGRKPNFLTVNSPTAAAACEALYPGLTPPAECER